MSDGALASSQQQVGGTDVLTIPPTGLLRLLWRPRVFVWTAMGLFGVGFAFISIAVDRAFRTGRFDLGNMVQAVWSSAHGHPLAITNLQGHEVSRLASHFDPFLLLFVPLWRLWPSADMLLVAQARQSPADPPSRLSRG